MPKEITCMTREEQIEYLTKLWRERHTPEDEQRIMNSLNASISEKFKECVDLKKENKELKNLIDQLEKQNKDLSERLQELEYKGLPYNV